MRTGKLILMIICIGLLGCDDSSSENNSLNNTNNVSNNTNSNSSTNNTNNTNNINNSNVSNNTNSANNTNSTNSTNNTNSTNSTSNTNNANPPSIGNLVINEVSAADDWIELFNNGPGPLDISGYYLLDSNLTHTPYVFPTGTTLGENEYLVISRTDGSSDGFDWGLSAASDAVNFFDSGDTLMLSVEWTEGDIPDGGSYGRIPDGTGPFTGITNPTPGTANQ